MEKLTKKYIDAHSSEVHTHESFARLLVDILLKEAWEKVGDEGVEEFSTNLEFKVTPFEPKGCIRICVRRADGSWWCVHQNTR